MPTSIKIHIPACNDTVEDPVTVSGSVYSTSPNVLVRVSINDINGMQVAQDVAVPVYYDPTTEIGLWSVPFNDGEIPDSPSYEAVAIAFQGNQTLASDSCNFSVGAFMRPMKKPKNQKTAKAPTKKKTTTA